MGCYSGDHIAEDHIHTGITTCSIYEGPTTEVPTWNGQELITGGGGGGEGFKLILLDPNPHCSGSKLLVRIKIP